LLLTKGYLFCIYSYNLGVLSGVCTIDDLSPGADHVIENIDHMLPLIMPRHFDSSNRSTSHSGKLSSVQYDKVEIKEVRRPIVRMRYRVLA
jgi:hypothetical protein